MKYNKNMEKSLNLNFLKYTNKSKYVGHFDIPCVYCNIKKFPDFIALYSEKNLYYKTPRTAVAFYQYDNIFDGINGLGAAIYFNKKSLIKKYKQRFKNVKYIILPDYSILGDIPKCVNDFRIFMSRVVGLWFTFELGITIIPNISFCDDHTQNLSLSGLDKCNTAAISTKGHISEKGEYERLHNKIKEIVDTLNIENLIVYDVCGDESKTLYVLEYAIQKGINVVIPENTLKIQNKKRVSLKSYKK